MDRIKVTRGAIILAHLLSLLITGAYINMMKLNQFIPASITYLAPMLKYATYLILAIIIFKPTFQWILGLLIMLQLILSPKTGLALLAIVVYLTGTLRTHYTQQKVVVTRGLISGISMVIIAYGLLAALGYFTAPYFKQLLQWSPPLAGDAAAVVVLLESTILYQLLLASIIVAFIYRAIKAVVDVIVAYRARGEAARGLIDLEMQKQFRQVLFFEGPQYNALEWGSSLLLTMLVAPLIYPPIRNMLAYFIQLMGLTPKGWMVIIAALLSTAAAWIPLKILISALIRTQPVYYLLNAKGWRRIAAISLIALTAIVPLVIISPAARDLLLEVVTGKPYGALDPLSTNLREPSNEYYQNLARLLDLIVKLFWGG